jgi:hypothetical protein
MLNCDPSREVNDCIVTGNMNSRRYLRVGIVPSRKVNVGYGLPQIKMDDNSGSMDEAEDMDVIDGREGIEVDDVDIEKEGEAAAELDLDDIIAPEMEETEEDRLFKEEQAKRLEKLRAVKEHSGVDGKSTICIFLFLFLFFFSLILHYTYLHVTKLLSCI